VILFLHCSKCLGGLRRGSAVPKRSGRAGWTLTGHWLGIAGLQGEGTGARERGPAVHWAGCYPGGGKGKKRGKVRPKKGAERGEGRGGKRKRGRQGERGKEERKEERNKRGKQKRRKEGGEKKGRK